MLWALESEGDISEVFETKFGFHIVRLDEIASVDIASFEDRKDALQEDLIGELAREKLEIMAEELERFVFEESISLVNTSQFGLGIESPVTCQHLTLQKSLVVILLLIQGFSAKFVQRSIV